ncbi:hypothetical protein O1L60_10635 [Streptomyces diastatochromogenes]|nr:hypothetical protein [Streptomyces diastatochromogenes]
MKLGTTAPEIATAPAIEHVITAPLDELLVEQNARLVEINLTDPEFFGAVLLRKSTGKVVLAMPAGREPIEQDCAARFLLAFHLGLPTDQFPTFITAETVTPSVETGE